MKRNYPLIHSYEEAKKYPLGTARLTISGAKRRLRNPGDMIEFIIRKDKKNQGFTGEAFFNKVYIGYALSYMGEDPTLEEVIIDSSPKN